VKRWNWFEVYNLFVSTLVGHLLVIVGYVVLGLIAFATVVVVLENITNSQLGDWLEWIVSFFAHDSVKNTSKVRQVTLSVVSRHV